MYDLVKLAAVAVVFLAAQMAGGPNPRQAGAGEPPPLELVVQDFEGTAADGRWDIHRYPGDSGDFEYSVRPDALVMIDKENRNQNLTRRGLELDPNGRYAVEARFRIDEPEGAPPPNSFCVNFLVAGAEGELDSISCWSVNLTVQPVEGARGMMLYMGFIDGKFKNIGRRTVDWCKTNTEYLFRVEVNTDLAGRHKPKMVTVTIKEGESVRERFEVDYSAFPFQPDYSGPVRVGVNSHGADWTMHSFKVYADRSP